MKKLSIKVRVDEILHISLFPLFEQITNLCVFVCLPPDIFARLMKPPAYAGHDAQWERSVALEKKA